MNKRSFVVPIVISLSLLVGLFARFPGKNPSVSSVSAAGNFPYGSLGTNWVQTFADEFDGTSLNRTIWQSDIPNGGNGELQEYVNDDSHNNYLVNNGILQIVARQEYYMGRNYTSGVILTQNHFRQKYGYFEMRAKVPHGKGLWPAFWMLADPWVPEIDITEILGGQTNTTYMTLHYSTSAGTSQTMSSYVGPDFSTDYHVYGVDWEPNALVWYVDGVERKRITDTSIIPNVSMWILANLAVGGNWPGNPDSTTVFPAYLNIDYIRAWQKSTSPTSPTATSIAPTTTAVPTNSQNLISNASFETAGASPWYAPWGQRNDLAATFSQDTTTAANSTQASMKVSLPTSNSSQPWVVSVMQQGKALTASQAYTLSFWAKASAQRPIHAVIQDGNSPYTEYTNQLANLTSSWAKYSYSFTASATTNTAMVNFNLADAAGTVWLDEVSLCSAGSNCAGSSVSPLPSPSATATTKPTLSPTATATAKPTLPPTATATFQSSDTTPPAVSITSPVSGSIVSRRTIVTITANATDNVGVAKVEFRVNGSLICTDTIAPYTCGWNVPNHRSTTYTIEARAYDLAQNTASASIKLTTSN